MPTQTFVQDPLAEQKALQESLLSGTQGGANQRYAQGTDIPSVLSSNPATRQLLQEQVYSRAYGTGNPTFTKPASSITPGTVDASAYSQQNPYAPGSANANTWEAQNRPAAPEMSSGNDFVSAINARYGNQPAFDEKAYRAERMAELQTQIDAIRNQYADTIAQSQEQGRNRLGQQRGLSTISGTRYSPRGAAEQANVDTVNQQAIDAINTDMNAEIARARAASEGLVTNEIQYRGNLAQQQADSYLSNILSAYKLNQDQVSAEADRAYRNAQLTGNLNGTDTLALRQFLIDTQNQQFQNSLSAQELQAKIDQAKQKNYSISQLDDGTVVAFDPQTGTINPLGRYAKTPAAGSGGIGASSAADIANAFAGRYGSDNYLDTSVYADQYRKAAQRGAAASFLKQYPVEAYLNPYDPTAIPFFGGNPAYPTDSGLSY